MTNETDTLFAEERKIRITEYINANKKATTETLSKHFNVSIATIRNDLKDLEKSNFIVRTHGGAIIKSKSSQELDLSSRTDNLQAKQELAKIALNFIDDGDTIILDSGTTIHELAKLLHVKKDLTIITNDITCVSILYESNFTIIFLGGTVDNKFHWSSGKYVHKMLVELSADKSFLSAGGFSIDKGFSVGMIALSEIKVSMIKSSVQNILLCDKSKFEKNKLSKFADLSDINVFITDNIDNNTKTIFEEHGMTVFSL